MGTCGRLRRHRTCLCLLRGLLSVVLIPRGLTTRFFLLRETHLLHLQTSSFGICKRRVRSSTFYSLWMAVTCSEEATKYVIITSYLLLPRPNLFSLLLFILLLNHVFPLLSFCFILPPERHMRFFEARAETWTSARQLFDIRGSQWEPKPVLRSPILNTKKRD